MIVTDLSNLTGRYTNFLLPQLIALPIYSDFVSSEFNCCALGWINQALSHIFFLFISAAIDIVFVIYNILKVDISVFADTKNRAEWQNLVRGVYRLILFIDLIWGAAKVDGAGCLVSIESVKAEELFDEDVFVNVDEFGLKKTTCFQFLALILWHVKQAIIIIGKYHRLCVSNI